MRFRDLRFSIEAISYMIMVHNVQVISGGGFRWVVRSFDCARCHGSCQTGFEHSNWRRRNMALNDRSPTVPDSIRWNVDN
jgi:hypothetical protein